MKAPMLTTSKARAYRLVAEAFTAHGVTPPPWSRAIPLDALATREQQDMILETLATRLEAQIVTANMHGLTLDRLVKHVRVALEMIEHPMARPDRP
jgi:hypothetical protein